MYNPWCIVYLPGQYNLTGVFVHVSVLVTNKFLDWQIFTVFSLNCLLNKDMLPIVTITKASVPKLLSTKYVHNNLLLSQQELTTDEKQCN